MRTIYELSIRSNYQGYYRDLSVSYFIKEQAEREMKRIVDDLRRKFNAPETSDDKWSIEKDEYPNGIYSIESFSDGHYCYITAFISEHMLLEPGDNICLMKGAVVKNVKKPNVMARLLNPLLEGQTSLSTIDILDIEKSEKIKNPIIGYRTFDTASEEEGIQYYSKLHDINKKN